MLQTLLQSHRAIRERLPDRLSLAHTWGELQILEPQWLQKPSFAPVPGSTQDVQITPGRYPDSDPIASPCLRTIPKALASRGWAAPPAPPPKIYSPASTSSATATPIRFTPQGPKPTPKPPCKALRHKKKRHQDFQKSLNEISL